MKCFLPLISFALFCVAMLNANNPLLAQGDTAIYKTIGGAFEDEFTSVVYDNDSNLVFCGHSSSISEFGSKAILVKTDTLLNTLWSVSYGEYALSNFTDLIQDGDAYIVVGSTLNPSTSYDILITAFNEEGELLWDKHIGSENWDLANSISAVNGGYLVTGDTYTSSGKISSVIKLNTSGDIIWENTYGTNQEVSLLDGKESVSGDLIFCGNKIVNDSTSQYWFLKTTSEGSVLLETVSDSTYQNSFNSIVADPIDESYYVCGHIYNPITESEDAIISKLSSEGSIEWTSMIEYSGPQSFKNIDLNHSNNLICSGSTKDGEFGNEGIDILTKTHTRNNIFLDQRTIGTAGNELGNTIVRIANGYVICGYTDELGEGQNDGFMVRTRNSGSVSSNLIEEELLQNVSQSVGVTESDVFQSSLQMSVIENELLLSRPVREILIYDLSGALVFSQKGELFTKIFPDLKQGLYFVRTDEISRGKLFWP
ncbi:MAG: hypothetical protein AB8B53_03800 [Flavobacteriales bacterium]